MNTTTQEITAVVWHGQFWFCRHCKHWGTESWEMNNPKTRHCKRIEGRDGGDGARVAGFNEEGIETDAEFGCIHFESKE